MRKQLAVLFTFLFFSIPAFALDIQTSQTESGLNYWLVQDTSAPIVSFNLTFKSAGDAYTPDHLNGLGSILSTMLDQGAGPYDRKAFQDLLYKDAIQISASISPDGFSISGRTLKKNMATTAKLVNLMLTAPHFKDIDLQRTKDQLITSLRFTQQKPQYIAGKIWKETYFGDHPYGRKFDGTPESLQKVTAKDLHGFMQTHFALDNMVVSFAGDITQAEAANTLTTMTTKLPAKNQAELLPKFIPHSTPPSPIFKEMDVPQSILIFGQPFVGRNHPQFFEAAVLNQILGGSGGYPSQLNQIVRQDNGLVYYIYSNISLYDQSARLMGAAGTRTETAGKAARLTKEQWNLMRNKGPNKKSLAKTKKYMKGSYALNLDSTQNIVGVLNVLQYYNLGTDYLDKRSALIDNVTAQSVKTFAQEYLHPDALLFVTVGAKPTN